jgi:osmotically inducible lipoprotein OsmB
LLLNALIQWNIGILAWSLLKIGRDQLDRRFVMKNTALGTALLAVALLLGACASNPTNSQVGTAAGAVVGGVVGSALTGGSTVGTVGGAAAGAVIGHEIGRK